MSSSSTEVSTFIKSYPIDFYLHDDEGKNVLYIDDASGVHNHSLTLEIINTSARHIELINDKKWSKASVEHHHFELRFRPGVLDINEIKFPEIQDWSIEKQQNDGIISLYILHKNQNNTLNAKGKIVLNLQQIKASAGRGARVTQVELKYANLKYQNEKEPLSAGNRLQSLSIINHYGRKDIPLHVGFISGDDILNDGSPNELHLRIANTTLKEVSLKSINEVSLKSINLDVRPKFIISFDIGETDTNPWALGTESQVKSIKVEVKYPTLETNIWKPVNILSAQKMSPEEEIKGSKQNISPQWEINVSDLQKLNPGQSFEIKLSEIKTSHPSGHTNLYIRYENIPGYWDGQFICSIEKTPLLYRDDKIGIGTTSPKSSLEICKNKSKELGPILTLSNNSGESGAGAAIDFNGYDVKKNAPSARIQSIDDSNSSSHIVFFTKKAGSAGNKLEERFRISSDGKLEVKGELEVEKKLHAKGELEVEKKLHAKGELEVAEKLHAKGELEVEKKLHAKGELEVAEKLYAKGELEVEKKLHAKGELEVNLHYSKEYTLKVESDGKTHEEEMLPSGKYFAFITSISGSFDGGGESVYLEIKKNTKNNIDYWYLCGHSSQKGVVVKARCVAMQKIPE